MILFQPRSLDITKKKFHDRYKAVFTFADQSGTEVGNDGLYCRAAYLRARYITSPFSASEPDGSSHIDN